MAIIQPGVDAQRLRRVYSFALFAFFISWGIIELLKGKPWLLLASVGIFLGTFIKFGCQSH